MLQYQSVLLRKFIIFSKSYSDIKENITKHEQQYVIDNHTQQLLSHNTAKQNWKFYKDVTSTNASP